MPYGDVKCIKKISAFREKNLSGRPALQRENQVQQGTEVQIVPISPQKRESIPFQGCKLQIISPDIS